MIAYGHPKLSTPETGFQDIGLATSLAAAAEALYFRIPDDFTWFKRFYGSGGDASIFWMAHKVVNLVAI